MCDYSLHGLKNRLAQVNDSLVVYRFKTGTTGLASPREVRESQEYYERKTSLGGRIARKFVLSEREPVVCPVCIPDGAILVIGNVPETIQKFYDVGEQEEVVFRQLTQEEYRHRDGFEFRNGTRVSLQEFENGVNLKVLALESESSPVEHIYR